MNIGIDFRELIKEKTTGIGRFLLNFLEYAIKTDQKHIYYLYGNQHTDFRISHERIIHRIIPEKKTLYWDQRKIGRMLRQDKIDLFFSPYDKAPLSLPIPKVITVHDLLFAFLNKTGYRKRFFYNRLYLSYRRRIAKSADKIITVSEYSKNDILKLWHLNSKKISVVYNGISPQFRPITFDEISGRKFLDKFSIRKSYILYVGNFMPHKNVTTIIRAYSILSEDIREYYQLVLCGYRNNYAKPLEKQIADYGLESNIIFTDNISDSDLISLYNFADLFMFPSFYEGFGLPPLEAMACGTPVISSNISSLPEVLGDAAVLCDPNNHQQIADNIVQVLTDKSLRDSLIAKGIKQASQYQLEITARKLLEEITTLIDDTVCPRSSFVKHITTNSNPEITCLDFSNGKPEVTVVIPTLDAHREGYLPTLLEQIKQQSFQNFEILIIKGDSRQGRAINKGVCKSRGEIIIIMDDDTQIGHPDLFKHLIQTIRTDPSVGMVGVPNLVPKNAPRAIRSIMSQIPRKHSPMVNEITESDLAEHPCCAIPKKVFLEIGGENELIPRGVDPYLRMAIRKAGYRVVVIPEVFIHHLPSARTWSNCKKFFTNGKMAAYVNKFYPQFVIELPSKHRQAVRKKRRIPERIFSYIFRITVAFFSGKMYYLLSLFFYLFGFLWGYIHLKRKSV